MFKFDIDTLSMPATRKLEGVLRRSPTLRGLQEENGMIKIEKLPNSSNGTRGIAYRKKISLCTDVLSQLEYNNYGDEKYQKALGTVAHELGHIAQYLTADETIDTYAEMSQYSLEKYPNYTYAQLYDLMNKNPIIELYREFDARAFSVAVLEEIRIGAAPSQKKNKAYKDEMQKNYNPTPELQKFYLEKYMGDLTRDCFAARPASQDHYLLDNSLAIEIADIWDQSKSGAGYYGMKAAGCDLRALPWHRFLDPHFVDYQVRIFGYPSHRTRIPSLQLLAA